MFVILAGTHSSLTHKYLLLFLIKFITNFSQINLVRSEYNWLSNNILKKNYIFDQLINCDYLVEVWSL